MRAVFPRIALVLLLALHMQAAGQTVSDPELVVDTVVTGLLFPTTMAFVAPDDILVLQKANGQVLRVLSGNLQGSPVLDVHVNSASERGLLGIAVNPLDSTDVFLFFTEASGADGGAALANRVYRYVWNPVTGTLGGATLILDLPVDPGPNHDGGIVISDGTHLYVVIGDLNRDGQLENFPAGPAPDDTGVILRVLHDGSPAPGNPFTPYCSTTSTTTCVDSGDCPGGESCITEVASYYAYGVRNSFGLAFDPVTGGLWDTENGPGTYDEVNRVAAGFNSGWQRIMGPDVLDPQSVADLFDMPGAGSTYSDPEFSWFDTTAPTAIVFPSGSALGSNHDDVALVGDNNSGQIFRFPLDGTRAAFDFTGFPALEEDLVANDNSERDQLSWAQGLGAVTDLEIGPDGSLYVVSISAGAIYRIGPPKEVPASSFVGLALLGACLLAALAGTLRARVLWAGRRRGLVGSEARERPRSQA